MGVLRTDMTPRDVKSLAPEQLAELAGDIRSFLIDSVCGHGGHLGPNLGIVELTIALHRVFDSPHTPLVFDTGHQAYVHKLLTGRGTSFAHLRERGGLSGYPNRAESAHDHVENSHASTALSYADGLSKAYEMAGDRRSVVAVVGDGALTGGLSWEALNNIGSGHRRVVVVLNDNGRSYSPTVGGLPRHLARVQDRRGYGALVSALGGTPMGSAGRDENLFAALGFGYIGPVDGHDTTAVEAALRQAADHAGPVVVHCRTTKGLGYTPAEVDEADHLHTVGVVEVATGKPATPSATTWSDAFGDLLLEFGAERPDVVAITAAMMGPTKLQRFAEKFPDRCFDVGIAEQHAVTSAAGLAMAGAHPVVALYATFANRAFDQTLMDVGLHRMPVTFVLDRAGITGPDGPSHHGMWDLSLLGTVPGMRVAAPRDAQTLEEELREAVAQEDGPTALRFPKSTMAPPVPVAERWGSVDILRRGSRREVLLVAMGALAPAGLEAAGLLAAEGIECTVADPRWVLPPTPALLDLATGYRLVVTVEDGVRLGGAGAQVAQELAASGCDVPVCTLGLPTEYLPHGGRAQLLAEYGLDGAGVARSVQDAWDRRTGSQDSLRVLAPGPTFAR